MAPFFIDLATSASKLGYSLTADVLGLATRPLVFANWCLPGSLPTLEAFGSGGLLYGFLGTGSACLAGASIAVLVGRANFDKYFRFVASGYLVDALAQVPTLMWPAGPILASYPASFTGFVTLQLQVPLATMCFRGAWIHYPYQRWALLASAVSARYMSLVLVDQGGPSATLLYGAGAIFLTFGITPKSFWNFMGTCVEIAMRGLARFSAFVYGLVEICWPRLQNFVWAVLDHPFVVGLHQWIIAPTWQIVSPVLLPVATGAIALSCGMGVRDAINKQSAAATHDALILAVGNFFCGSTASLSTIILTVHAVGRWRRRTQTDPLKWSAAVKGLRGFSGLVSAPWRIGRAVWLRFFVHIIRPLLELGGRIFGQLLEFAATCPLLCIPCVLMANVAIVRSLSSSSGALTTLLAATAVESSSWTGQMAKTALRLQAAAADGTLTDSTFALFLTAIAQIVACSIVNELVATADVVVHPRTGDALSLDELNDIAAAMENPVMCGRCGFGPVDHRGCFSLSTHHGERTRSGFRISNSCPRCGWFAVNLSSWPVWDGEHQTPRGRSILRQRVWSEIVVVVRAASKALILPYGCLRFGHKVGWSPSVSAFLAFSYLLPWAFENQRLAGSINNPHAYRRNPARRQAAAQPVSTDDGDCGAAPQSLQLPAITQNEALRNIMTAVPESVYLASGDACSVCLEVFPEEAALRVSEMSGAAAADVLRAMVPPVVALRCGHPLHVDCAEAAVSAAGARHVRCPLCREPVTLSGETTARIFS